MGDTVLNVPPIKTLSNQDMRFLNGIPIGREEEHSRTGLNRGRRRQASKTLSDIWFLMYYIEKMIEDQNRMAAMITLEAVDGMFDLVVEEEPFAGGERDSQKRWTIIVNQLQKRLKVPINMA